MVPFELAPHGDRGDTRATFSVPAGLAEDLAAAPITAKGAVFALTVDEARKATGDAVFTVFYSPKPERTAEAIAERIAQRIRDPQGSSSAQEACVVS